MAPRRRSGFSLVELLVVIAIIAILIGLILAAAQKARMAAQRVVCVNNLHQTGLAIHGYIHLHGHYPSGGTPSPKRGWGHSWQTLILPHLELNNLGRQFDYQATSMPATVHTGLVYGPNSWGLDNNIHNGNLVMGQDIKYFFCPMSPLPKWVLQGLAPPGPTGVLSPTYTAINGAANHPSVLNNDANTYVHDATGKVSFGGVLPMRTRVRDIDIIDGAAHTIMVGEQSNWLLDADGSQRDGRSDWSHGFTMGPVPLPDWRGHMHDNRHFNGTTVRYRVNDRTYNQVGVGSPFYGANRPIQSVHPGGAHVLMADGSVHLLRDTVGLSLLYDLCNRDDGRSSPIP